MITLDDLKKPDLWKFAMHADGSDKGGRFSINLYECEINGVKLRGSKKLWRDGRGDSAYAVDGVTVSTLAEVVALLNQRFTAGDDARGAAGNDD